MAVQPVIHNMNADPGDVFLGIDLGTSSCKVALVDSSGKILAMSVMTAHAATIG